VNGRRTIDLLLTDVVMPNMNGRQLAERLSELPARHEGWSFMSGYTDDAIVHHGVLNAGMAFIQKPLTVDLLLKRSYASARWVGSPDARGRASLSFPGKKVSS